MSIDWKAESRRFDEVAELYDQYRPGYPDEVIEQIVTDSALPVGGRILEIGCGTGIATRLLAQRGYRILGIEQGANLAALAREKLRGYPRVSITVNTFEKWPPLERAFDLVFSAQAFHWIDKKIGYAKTAYVLKDSGCLALLWNMYPNPQGEIFEALNAVYREFAQEINNPVTISYQTLAKERELEIKRSGLFGPTKVSYYPWSQRYSVQQYLGLLNTYSDHLRLPEIRRKRLFKAVANVIEQHGGSIDKPYVAVSYVAHKIY
jgi:SAM-dependent methyltransferase